MVFASTSSNAVWLLAIVSRALAPVAFSQKLGSRSTVSGEIGRETLWRGLNLGHFRKLQRHALPRSTAAMRLRVQRIRYKV
ncbi:MAG: hypothetical protein ACK4NE_02545 [Albidovulum sp.]